jgi:hypothetical protein
MRGKCLGWPNPLHWRFADSTWQAGILAWAERADAIVIDVTDLSEHLKCELECIFANQPSEKIVLTFDLFGDDPFTQGLAKVASINHGLEARLRLWETE